MPEYLPQDVGENSLWGTQAIANPVKTQLQESIKADVLVVGGGYTGLSSALHLAEQGVSVVVLEARSIGFGASGRNAGLVNAGIWKNPNHVVKELGEAAAERFNLALRHRDRHDLGCTRLTIAVIIGDRVGEGIGAFEGGVRRCIGNKGRVL